MSGRRELVDDRAVLTEVSKFLHTSKANKKILVNARKTAKLAAEKPAAAAAAVAAPRAAPSKKGGKKDAEPVIPANAVLRKAGGAVWVMLKCSFDQELQRAKKAAREEQGKPVKEFVLPDTNARYRKRVAKWETVAEEEAAAAEEHEDEDGGDDVADAPEDEVEEAAEEEPAAPSRTDMLLTRYGTGASKCLVRTKSTTARNVKRKPLPAPEGTHSADAKIRAKTETSERRRCRQRRVKQQKATSVLASQKVAANFTTQLIALLRKDVYPQMKRSPAAAGDAAPSHKDPNATSAAAGSGASPSSGKGGKGSQPKSNKGGKSGGKGKNK